MRDRPDFATLVERAYGPRSDTASWVRHMASGVAALLDPQHRGGFYQLRSANGVVVGGTVPAMRSATGGADDEDTPLSTPARPQDAQLGIDAGLLPTWTPATMPTGGAHGLALVVPMAADRRAVFGIRGWRAQPVDRAVQSLWRNLAAHLGFACEVGTVGSIPEADCARRATELFRGLFWGRWQIVANAEDGGAETRFVGRACHPVEQSLSIRQRQALFCAAAGWSNQEIAHALGIGEASAATHLGRALRSTGLGARNRAMRLSAGLTELLLDRLDNRGAYEAVDHAATGAA